jgi:hypothetical protein
MPYGKEGGGLRDGPLRQQGTGDRMAKKTIKTRPPADPRSPAAAALESEDRSQGRGLIVRGRETFAKVREVATDGIGRRASGPQASRRAAGGRLDLVSGAFGVGSVWIALFGPDRQPGFVSPQGDFVDLAADLEAPLVWPDREEYRLLSAIGWAWTMGTVAGPLGVVLGGGIRLLHPRRMFIDCRLRDGRAFAARTDSVTAGALEAIGRDAGGVPASAPAG